MNNDLVKKISKTAKRIFILLVFITAKSPSSYGQDKSVAPTITDSLPEVHESWDRFSISMGGFLSNYNSGISFGSEQLGIGVHIDLEDALGLKTSTFGFRGNASYRIGKNKRHAVSFGYFGIFRNSHKVLETELEVGNIVIPLGTEITSNFDLTILRIIYDYSFLQNEHVSLGASFGLFVMPISFSIKTLHLGSQVASFVAPLPVLGLRSDFMIVKNIYLHQSVELLLLRIDNFQGRILDLDISLEHLTFNNVSFGLGINSNRLNITKKNKDNTIIDFFGEIEMEYTGAYIFAKYRF